MIAGRLPAPSCATRLAALLLAGWIAAALSGRAAAQELTVDLSEDVVRITTGFAGARLLLFGAIEAPGAEIAVAVRGPSGGEVVRRKERVVGIWLNRAEATFFNVPAFYGLAASKPLEEVLTPRRRRDFQLGAENLVLVSKSGPQPGDVQAFREALVRNKQASGLYAIRAEPVRFVGQRLFRTEIALPANVPIGTYSVDVYLIRGGDVATVRSTRLQVRKSGFETSMYKLAQDFSALYGALAILIAVMAGWLANLPFRKA